MADIDQEKIEEEYTYEKIKFRRIIWRARYGRKCTLRRKEFNHAYENQPFAYSKGLEKGKD